MATYASSSASTSPESTAATNIASAVSITAALASATNSGSVGANL